MTVIQCGLDRHREAHRLTQVIDPVAGVEGWSGARVIEGGRVIRHLRFPWNEFGKFSREIGEDGIDLWRVRGDVDGHLAGHHIGGLPGRHQFANRVGGATDDCGLRRGEYRHHHIVDPTGSQFVAHLLGGQLDGGHRAAAG